MSRPKDGGVVPLRRMPQDDFFNQVRHRLPDFGSRCDQPHRRQNGSILREDGKGTEMFRVVVGSGSLHPARRKMARHVEVHYGIVLFPGFVMVVMA